MSEAITIRSQDELLAVIPHVLGFQPSESMVCLPFGGAPVARLDLPRGEDDIAGFIEALAEVYLMRYHPDRLALVAYGSHNEQTIAALNALTRTLAGPSPHDDADPALRPALRPALGKTMGETMGETMEQASGPLVGPVLWVRGEEWTDLITGARGVVSSSSATRMDAEFAVRGRTMPGASRDTLAEALRGDPEPVRSRMSAARKALASLSEPDRGRETTWVVERVERFQRDRVRLPDDEAARLLLAITDPPVRDAVMHGVSRASAPLHCDLWHDLTRRAPAEVRDTPATLLALCSWLDGRGAHAWVALDRVQNLADNRLARLVAQSLELAVDPTIWETLSDPSPSSATPRASGSHPAAAGRKRRRPRPVDPIAPTARPGAPGSGTPGSGVPGSGAPGSSARERNTPGSRLPRSGTPGTDAGGPIPDR